jgi:hypothetical protein
VYTIPGLNPGTYNVTPSKPGCIFSPPSLSVTVGPSTSGRSFSANCSSGGGDVTLTSGVPLTNQSVAASAWRYYSLNVPSGATEVRFATTNATGDADLYTNFGSKPTASTYLCRPYSASGNETCVHSSPSAGTWWVGVRGYAAATFTITGTAVTSAQTYAISGNAGTAGAVVTAGGRSATTSSTGAYTISGLPAGSYSVIPAKAGCTFSPPSLSVSVGPSSTGRNFSANCSTGDTQLTSGVALSGQSVASGAWRYYFINIPSGTTSLTVSTTNATGDVDLYTNYGSKPTTSMYRCRPYTTSGNETCTHASPSAGTWWIGVRGYNAGTFTIRATRSP